MLVPMVLVVHVPVIVRNRRMDMLMVVPGADEQRDSRRHGDCCENVTSGPLFREEWDCEQHTCERCRREHGGLLSCAESAHRVGVEQHADPVCRRASASPMFTPAATPVFTATIWNGSRIESFWVRLLSIAHPTHAAMMSHHPACRARHPVLASR